MRLENQRSGADIGGQLYYAINTRLFRFKFMRICLFERLGLGLEILLKGVRCLRGSSEHRERVFELRGALETCNGTPEEAQDWDSISELSISELFIQRRSALERRVTIAVDYGTKEKGFSWKFTCTGCKIEGFSISCGRVG